MTPKLNVQIYEEACEWFIDFRTNEINDASSRDFDQWSRKSPEHLAAYLEIAAIWDQASALDPDNKWDRETLLAQALPGTENVFPINPQIPHPTASKTDSTEGESGVSSTSRGISQAYLPYNILMRRRLAATIAAICLVAGVLFWHASRTLIYETGLGEHRSIKLADGSSIEIDSQSKIAVQYTATERSIDLLQGQAMFHVAKDRKRPFVVTSGAAQVQAVGTLFDIDQTRSRTVVTVMEGSVAVVVQRAETGESKTADRSSPLAASSSTPVASQATGFPMTLSTGEQLTVASAAITKATILNLTNVSAWTRGQLAFDAASLLEVADEFNRYNERPLVITDRSLYDLHITGIFSSTNPESFIRFLRERPEVQVIETPSEIRVAKRGA